MYCADVAMCPSTKTPRRVMRISTRQITRIMFVFTLICAGVMPSQIVSADSNETVIGSSLISYFSSLAVGDDHSCVLLSSGNVKCWGYNAYGQLGDGSTTTRSTPVKVLNLESTVVALSAAEGHTCALLVTGGVQCWGNGTQGQIGDGSRNNRLTPVYVNGLASGVAAITAGGTHSCALLTTGGVKCWGDNAYGQLGTNDTTDRALPTDVSGLSTGVAAISAGKGHTCASLTAGGMKCWGDNYFGQLGDNTVKRQLVPTSVVGLSSSYIQVNAISTSTSHTCALLSVGGVKCWGLNTYGQLGDSTLISRKIPTSVVGLNTGAVGVSTGRWNTCALLATGGVKCWGTRLGIDNAPKDTTPTDVSGLSAGVNALSSGYDHTCALLTNNTVKCWGWNAEGQLGLGDGAISSSAEPTSVMALTDSVDPTTNTSPSSQNSVTSGGPRSQRHVYLRVGSTMQVRRILALKSITVPSRSRVRAITLSPRFCSVSRGTRIKGVRFGTCRLKVSITSTTSKKPRTTIKRVQITIR